MSKVYILTEEDFKQLIEKLKIDPDREGNLVNSSLPKEQARHIYGQAYRMYHYVVSRWIDKVKE